MSNTEQTQQWSPPVGQSVEQPTDNSRRNRWLATGAALAIGVGGIAALASCENDSNADGSNGDAPSEVSADEIRDIFSITKSNEDQAQYECLVDGVETGTIDTSEFSNGIVIVNQKINSTLPVDPTLRDQDHRNDFSSVANPLTSVEITSENRVALLDEISATNCEDAAAASQLANYLANLTIDGIKVSDVAIAVDPETGEKVKWLKPYEGDASAINDNAAKLMPAFGKDSSELSDEEAFEAYEANLAHQELAENLNTILRRFVNEGVINAQTILNYQVDYTQSGFSVGSIPEFALNDDQYTGRFLQLVAVDKDGDCIFDLGFNTEDQRVVATGVCDVPETPETTPPTHTVPPETTPPTHTVPPETPPPTDGRKVPGTTIGATENTSAPNPNIGDDYDNGNPPSTAAPDRTPDDVIIINPVPEEDEQKGTEEPERDDEPQPRPTIAPSGTSPDFVENDGDDSDNNDGTVVVNR
jgi:hypothetical protein